MRIRAVEASELAELKALRLRALTDAPGAFGSTYEREAARPPEEYRSWIIEDCVTFVAEDDAGWHGLAVGQPDRETAGVTHVLSMWVAPDHRRTGIGRLLLERTVAWGWDHGAARMRLGVAEGNSAAKRLYLSYGFEPTGHCEPLRSAPSRMCEFLELAGVAEETG